MDAETLVTPNLPKMDASLMGFYVVTFHETDGNECTVYDAIVKADSEEHALSILAYSVESSMNENGTRYEEDGSEFGYYFADDEGGIALRDVTRYESLVDAEDACAFYHVTWHV
jgi:hypothetical protein